MLPLNRLSMEIEADTTENIKMDKRLINYISMISYMYSSNAIKNNDLNSLEKYLSIYREVDPENPDYIAFREIYLNKSNKK